MLFYIFWYSPFIKNYIDIAIFIKIFKILKKLGFPLTNQNMGVKLSLSFETNIHQKVTTGLAISCYF